MNPVKVEHFVKKMSDDCKIKVNVRSTMELKLRSLIAAWLIKLAGKALGCDIEIVHDD